MAKRNLLLLSSSKVHGYDFLEYAKDDIIDFFKNKNVSRILFIPYALFDHDSYLSKVSDVLTKWGFQVDGIHRNDPIEAINSAQGIFVGGGNTFVLLKTLYEKNLINPLRKRILENGVPYMGSSAGTNIAAMSINNTNDMPIVYPPSFNALQLIPFNINPHYFDADKMSTHKGETREERILQYQQLPECYKVLGLREGGTLLVDGDRAILKGINPARLFVKNAKPIEIDVGADLSFLLKN